jgi:hypothetical protein
MTEKFLGVVAQKDNKLIKNGFCCKEIGQHTYLGNMTNGEKNGKFFIDLGYTYGEMRNGWFKRSYGLSTAKTADDNMKKKINEFIKTYKNDFYTYWNFVKGEIEKEYKDTKPEVNDKGTWVKPINNDDFWKDITKPFTDKYNEIYACKQILPPDDSLCEIK